MCVERVPVEGDYLGMILRESWSHRGVPATRHGGAEPTLSIVSEHSLQHGSIEQSLRTLSSPSSTLPVMNQTLNLLDI